MKKNKIRDENTIPTPESEVHKVAATTRRHQYTASRIFAAEHHGTCPRCAGEIEPGERVRYVEYDGLVHARHAPRAQRPIEICTRCNMTQPCECE